MSAVQDREWNARGSRRGGLDGAQAESGSHCAPVAFPATVACAPSHPLLSSASHCCALPPSEARRLSQAQRLSRTCDRHSPDGPACQLLPSYSGQLISIDVSKGTTFTPCGNATVDAVDALAASQARVSFV